MARLDVAIGVFNRLCESALVPAVLIVGSHRMLTKHQIELVGFALEHEGTVPNKVIIDKLNKEWLKKWNQ